MSNTINTNKYVGVGKRFIIPPSSSGCVFPGWSTIQAQDYWNALTAANGGVEVNGSLYGTTTCALKIALDNWFSATYNTLFTGQVYLHIGGTQATHAINAYNPGTYNLTFTGGVTYTSQGSVFDGTGAADTGVVISTLYGSGGNISVGAKTLNSSGNTLMGCRDTASVSSDKIDFLYVGSNIRSDMYRTAPAPCTTTSRVDVAAPYDAFSITVRDTTNLYIYQNGTSIGSVTGAYCGSSPSIATMHIAAMNTGNTSHSLYYTGTMAINLVGKKMTGAQVAAFTTATNTLMTVLGR